jgi:hypothetical protein
MKSNVMPSIVQIEANQLKQLVSEVKETVATGIIQVNKTKRNTTSFGVVDLWNIQRSARTMASRRAF